MHRPNGDLEHLSQYGQVSAFLQASTLVTPVFAMYYRENIRREPMRYLMIDVLKDNLPFTSMPLLYNSSYRQKPSSAFLLICDTLSKIMVSHALAFLYSLFHSGLSCFVLIRLYPSTHIINALSFSITSTIHLF